MVSIITPILNEKEQIPGYLEHISELEGNFECLLVDGGSVDESTEIIRQHPQFQLLFSDKGRGRQMNKGAKAAKGDIFLFLHVDTRLPKDALNKIEIRLQDTSIKAGSFQLQFDADHFLLAVFAWFSRFNHPLCTYGDQCLFVRAKTFFDVGMFKEIPVMEDIEIQNRLRQRGTFAKLPQKAITSDRRFKENGILLQFCKNVLLVSSYYLGVSPEVLKRFYPNSR